MAACTARLQRKSDTHLSLVEDCEGRHRKTASDLVLKLAYKVRTRCRVLHTSGQLNVQLGLDSVLCQSAVTELLAVNVPTAQAEVAAGVHRGPMY
jgi:hypothetical protein